MNKLKQFISWLDVHALFILSTFLIIFIPLFPKIPIFEILPGYIVRARPEDVLIFLTGLIWITDAYRRRFTVNTTYFQLVILFLISGITSILLGTILIHTIPAQLLHIGKSGLHLFRYLEYFAVFFFAYSSIKKQKQLYIVIAILAITVLSVVLYGFGQEYYHLPLFSTMNREYSKGTTLYLQEGARPQSTFAGHYDLAAYLVIVLPLLFSVAIGMLQIDTKNIQNTIKSKQNYLSIILHLIHILGAWMLVTSGSKTALLAYIVGLFLVVIQHLHKLGNIRQQLKWGSIALVLISISLMIFLNFFALATRDKLVSIIKTSLPGTNSIENMTNRPDDLVGDGHEFKLITKENEDGTQTKEWVRQESVWSANALKYGLSMGIRLDTLWPNALKGLMNNPLFGSGYATLSTIDTFGEYSFAESTDNNFLRTLGETGLVGFIVFYGFIITITVEIMKQKKQKFEISHSLKIGFIGSIIGILINATYIDVFAASKVAYTFWMFAGITLAILKPDPKRSITVIKSHIYKNRSLYLAIFLAFFLLHNNPFNQQALIRNLEVSDTQIESLTSARCFIKTGSFTVCRPSGLILKQNINLYSILLVPLYKLYDNPMMFYVLNILLIIAVLTVLHLILKRMKSKQIFIFGALLLFILIASYFEFTNTPHTTESLLLFLICLPSSLGLTAILLNKISPRIAYIMQICIILFATLSLANSNFGSKILEQFRNISEPKKQTTLAIINTHIDTNRYLNRTKDFYVISTLNPYYVDMFSNGYYNLLPLSETQPYAQAPQKTYEALVEKNEPLTELYSSLLQSSNIFITDFGIDSNTEYKNQFTKMKDNFKLSYVAIGCDDTCNLYSVALKKEIRSPEPVSINDKKIILDDLNKKYSFAIVSNRFEPKTQYDVNNKGYSTELFATNLQSQLNTKNNFTIITGDVYADHEKSSEIVFNSLYKSIPILYNPGNYDLLETKYHQASNAYFYTDSEFFLFLNLSEDSTLSSTNKIFVYNALLELEKLPNIKNIIVVSHNLNWENRSNPDNFIFDLEKKLAQFPQIKKYIVTSHHSETTDPLQLRTEISARHIVDDTTNTHYLSSFVRDWENDSFFEFSISDDSTITIDYKLKNGKR